MVVHAQAKMGESSANPTDPHHTPTITQPSSSQPQKKQTPRKPSRNNTKVPQPSGTPDIVADEAVYKERVVVPGAKKPWGILLLELGLREYLNFPMIQCSQEIKIAQDNEIAKLKKRVKKLEQNRRSRTHGLKRLRKNVNEEIMFDVSDLAGEEVFVTEQGVPDSKKDDVVSTGGAAQVSTAATTVTITPEEITLAQALQKLRTVKPKHKDLRSKDFDSIKELFDKAFKRVNTFVDYRTEVMEEAEVIESSSKRARDEPEQEVTKKQKIDDNQEAARMKELMEIIPDEEEVAIDAIPLATQPPSIVLKSFDREDLETLWKLGRIVGIKSLLEVTAAKLMLLLYKLLLLVFRVNAAGTKLQLLKDTDCLKIKITYVIRIIIYRIDL
ncbi:hypothetical protein Tco_0660526 [Tanacetum coccineum]